MKDMMKPALILSGIYIIAALLLSALDGVTSPIIETMNEKANNEARQLVLSEATEFTLIEGLTGENVAEVWEGKNGEDVVGYTIKTLPKGYGGEMEVIVGISVDGIITGVDIGSHSETPGLGSKAKDESFKGQYLQKSVENPLQVVKGSANGESDIVAISGATITSNAVTLGVNSAIEIFNQNLANK